MLRANDMAKIKILKRSYKCSNESCNLHKEEGRTLEKDLIRVEEEDGHIDYKCPCCGSVIICVKLAIN